MNSIGIVICYFGKWPPWFTLFLKSCIYNNKIDWLFFSDQNLPIHSKNIKFHPFSKEQFNKLATTKLGFSIKIKDPYKLCDFKPLYGKIYEDYLLNYKFWGYSDIDIIYGQIHSFIKAEILNHFDIISVYQGFLSGPFCLYRNNDHIKGLFKQSVNSPVVYKTLKYVGFDENIQRSKIITISLHKIIKAIQFTFQYLLTGRFRKSSWKDFRYQFQWFYKKNTIKPKNLVDMTEVVWFNSKQSKIKAHFSELMLSDRHFNRIKNKDWELVWDNGKLAKKKCGKNIMAFHFIDLKNNTSWEVSDYIDFNGKFLINPKGIQIE